MNEIPDILGRALHAPIVLTFSTHDEARRWRYRVYNYIKRKAPEMSQLMMTQHGNQIKIRVPEMEISND